MRYSTSEVQYYCTGTSYILLYAPLLYNMTHVIQLYDRSITPQATSLWRKVVCRLRRKGYTALESSSLCSAAVLTAVLPVVVLNI